MSIGLGIDRLEAALDAERRHLIHANEERLNRYLEAAEAWRHAWPGIETEIDGMPLDTAHRHIVREAEKLLPFAPAGEVWP